MTTRVLVAAVLVATFAGCTMSGNNDRAAAETERTKATTAQTEQDQPVKLSWEKSFRFPQGRFSQRFVIDAPEPPSHTWDVRVVQPQDADMIVGIRTWYGYDFHVFDSTAGVEASACQSSGGSLECIARFPALEAQRPGRWTVKVEKLSNPPAEVHVGIRFTPLGER